MALDGTSQEVKSSFTQLIFQSHLNTYRGYLRDNPMLHLFRVGVRFFLRY